MVVFLCNSMSAVAGMQQAEIDKHAGIIEAKITRERYMMYGFTAFSVVQELYRWTPFFMGLWGKSFVNQVKEDKKPLLQSCKEGFEWIFYTKQGWISIIQSGVSIGEFIIISKMSEKLFHPNTLRWYIKTHAPYMRTIGLMQEHVSALQDTALEQSVIASHKEFLSELYDCLVHHSTLMCGYMTYKVKSFENEEQIIGKRAVQCIINDQNNWLMRIGSQLKVDVPNYPEIEKLLLGYKMDVASYINHFSLIEGGRV